MNATILVVCYKSKTLSNGEHPFIYLKKTLFIYLCFIKKYNFASNHRVLHVRI